MADRPTVLSVLYLDPRKLGSLEEYLVFLSRALRERGWRSVLVFSHPIAGPVRAQFEGTDAVFEEFSSASRLSLHASLLRLLWRYRAQVVHFHFFDHFSLLPLLAWRARPRAVVFTEHVRQPQPLRKSTQIKCWFWDRVVLRLLGTRILAVSRHIKSVLADCYRMSPERIQVVHNGVNLRRFVPVSSQQRARLRRELGIPLDRPVVVCASALRPEKGISDLLRAAQEVLAASPETFFVIVGDGPEAEPLRRQARELQIEPSVWFAGLRSDVHSFMAAADVVAVPSTWQEPAGLVVLEAMACACPVVATRVGGIPEHMDDAVHGLLVEPACPSALAQALLTLLNDPIRAGQMGHAARSRVEQAFSLDRWVRDTLDVYQPALSQTGE